VSLTYPLTVHTHTHQLVLSRPKDPAHAAKFANNSSFLTFCVVLSPFAHCNSRCPPSPQSSNPWAAHSLPPSPEEFVRKSARCLCSTLYTISFTISNYFRYSCPHTDLVRPTDPTLGRNAFQLHRTYRLYAIIRTQVDIDTHYRPSSRLGSLWRVG
jgi:hypothetical protein